MSLNNVSIPSTVSLSLTSSVTGPVGSTLNCDTGVNTWNGPIKLSGVDGTVNLNNAGNTLNIAGNITGGSFAGRLWFRGAGPTTVSGTINIGTAQLRKGDTGPLTINSTGNAWGDTILAQAPLVLGAANALPTTTVVTNDSDNTAFLDLAGFNQQVAGLYSGVGALYVTNSSPTTSTLTFDNSSASDTFGGQIVDGAGQVALTVNGGALILTGPSTYSGSTLLNTGTLEVPTSQTGGGAFTVNDGTTLGVTAAGATSLNLSALTLGSSTAGATNNFTLNGGPTVPVVNATNLTTHGPITVNISGGGLSLGQFALIDYTGSIGGDGYTFALETLPSGIGAWLSNNTANSSVDLVVTNAPVLVWTGQASGDWDIGLSVNWSNAITEVTYSDGPSVRFDDTAPGTTTINLTTNVSPGGVVVSNVSLTYSLGGTNGIMGSGGFTKEGTGLLIVSNTFNSYAGDTTISAGTYQLGASGMIPHGLGKGDLTLDGTFDMAGFSESLNGLSGLGTVENTVGGSSIITVGNNNASSTFSGTLANSSGSVALTKVGSGAFTLTGANSYSGGTVISEGGLRLDIADALGTGPVTLGGGGLSSDSSSPCTITNSLFVTANSSLGDASDNGLLTFPGTVDFAADARNLTIASDVVWSGTVGNGAVAKYGPATLYLQGATADFATDTATKDGTIIIDNAWVTQSGGAFRVNADTLLARLVITNGGTLIIPSTRLRVGYSNGSASATNIVDIAGTLDLQWTAGPNGKVRMGDQAQRAVVNLLTNGLLRTRGFDPAGPNASEVNFDGGTLQANAGPDATGFMEGLTVAYVRAGGAIVDTAGQSIQIGQPLLDGGGNGGLIVQGYGRLSLNGINTYTGTTVVSNGILGGIGVISGPVQVADYAELSPGNSIGTLTVSNTVTLAANATCTMELDRDTALKCDKLVANSIVAGGTLNIQNIGADLQANDTFNLFVGPLSGSFSYTNLPTLPTDLFWDTSQLGLNGTIRVVGFLFAAPVVNGTDLILSGTGPANATYYVLTSTNVALPLAAWTPVATNTFDGSSNFSFTNTISTAVPQQYFRLQLP